MGGARSGAPGAAEGSLCSCIDRGRPGMSHREGEVFATTSHPPSARGEPGSPRRRTVPEKADSPLPPARGTSGSLGPRDDHGHSRQVGEHVWPMVARAVIIDELVHRPIAEEADRVLNLAAGFDARPYRMDLPAELSWREADLPAIIEEKTRALAGETPRCRLESVAVDLAHEGERAAFLDRGDRRRSPARSCATSVRFTKTGSPGASPLPAQGGDPARATRVLRRFELGTRVAAARTVSVQRSRSGVIESTPPTERSRRRGSRSHRSRSNPWASRRPAAGSRRQDWLDWPGRTQCRERTCTDCSRTRCRPRSRCCRTLAPSPGTASCRRRSRTPGRSRSTPRCNKGRPRSRRRCPRT